MDFWGQSKNSDLKEFADFANEWLSSNNLPNDGEDSLDWTQLAGIARHPEVSPVCAVLGGILGNEVIKAFTGKGEPANNVILFNGLIGGCRSFLISSHNPLPAKLFNQVALSIFIWRFNSPVSFFSSS